MATGQHFLNRLVEGGKKKGGGRGCDSLVHILNKLSTFRGSTLAMWLMSKDSIGLDSREGIFAGLWYCLSGC